MHLQLPVLNQVLAIQNFGLRLKLAKDKVTQYSKKVLQQTWIGNNQKYSIWTVFDEIWNNI